MAKTRKVELANGRTVRLTIGEINAVRAYVKANGREGYQGSGLQFRPSGVRYDTVNSLCRKGVLVWESGQVERFAEGVFS